MSHLNVLNLAQSSKGDIAYKKISYPDGQRDLIIDVSTLEHKPQQVTIVSRFNSFGDWEPIAVANKALKRNEVKEVHLVIPYLLGARSDRQFEVGGCSYLVDIIAPLVNAQAFASVTFWDCHSELGVGLIHNSRNINNAKLVQWALAQIAPSHTDADKLALVTPDGGALKKIYETLTTANLDLDLVNSSKHRNAKGKLVGFHVPLQPEQTHKDLVWVDDICDGGGTFIGEAIEADKQGHTGKKYLIVTHGLFTNGFENLSKYFDGIFCTNSYADFDHPIVKQLNIF